MKKGSVTTTKLNTYKKNYKRFMQQQQQQKQKNNPNYNTNYTPRYKLVRRSNSQDNFISKKDAKITEKYITEDMLDDVRTRLTSLIEFKTKYYVDQRMLTLMQSDDILTRGADAIRITSDWSTGGKAFIFSNNGEPVAKITDGGVLYCKNIWMNGVNMMQLVNNILNSLSDGASIYVKHIDLKNGTYEMDIKEAIMKHLLIKPDNTDNNTLECFNGDGYGMLMNTDKGAGYVMFNPNMSNGNTIYGLRFGKNDSTGANIRYTYSTTAANSYLAMGPINKADTLNVYYDRRVIINTANNLSQCLLCKYSGNLGNNQYLRIGCGDNRDTGIFAYGRNNNADYLYLKLQGRSASIAVYANYTSFDANDYIKCNVTKKNADVLQLLTSQTLSNNDYIRYLISDNGGGKANIDLMHDTQYYGLRLKIDTPDNINDNKLCIWPTGVTIDGKLDAYNDVVCWENLEVADGKILTLNNTSISAVAKGSDVNDDTKINDNTIATTAYIKNVNINTSTHQQIPNNPYTSVAITDNPYLCWSVTNIGPYNTNTNAVCYSEELHQFVIVGNNGYSYFSYDGFTWMSNSMLSYTWTGVAYGPTHGYIACTSSNMYLLQSSDGRTWVPYNNVATYTGCAIVYGNGYYVIVPNGSNVSYVQYTTDPTVNTGWSFYYLGSSGKWYNIAYSKSQHKFVVVGASGKYVTFDDEFTSDSRTTGQLSGVTDDCHSVCYSDKLNLWVISCNNHAYCYSSPDGNTFTQQSLPYLDHWHRVVWGGDRFVMTCDINYKAAYSLDGVSWYPFEVSKSSSYASWLGLAYGNGVYVLSGNNNATPMNALVATYTSPNSYVTPRAIIQSIYPIGSIYMSMVNIHPDVIFGGYWTEIQNRFLYCVPTTSTSGDTGGSATHTHQYGMRWAGYWSCICGRGSDNVQFWNGSGWVGGTHTHDAKNNHPSGYTASNTAQWEAKVNTSSSSTMPPYITVYAWYRYA